MTKSRAGTILGITSVLIGLLGLAGVGCSPPKAGDKCKGGQAMCTDNASALSCGTDSKFFTMTCRGPKGCLKNGPAVNCDDSIAQEKDGCDEEGEVACSVDKKAALECHGNKFVVGETCKGARGCTVADEKISCDNDISDIGDPCHFIGDYACTADKTYALKCVDSKMTKLNSCRGVKGCRVFELPQEKKVEFICDDTIAQPDDACDEEGEHACSMDKKSIYVCKGLKFTMLKACDGPKGCTFDDKGEKFECDATTGTGKPVDVKQATPPGIPQKPGAAAPAAPKKK
jgi:hypothetical protein